MAKAEKNTVVRTVTTEVKVPVITVELSEHEAKCLVALLGTLGGQSIIRRTLSDPYGDTGRDKGDRPLRGVLTDKIGRWTHTGNSVFISDDAELRIY